MSATRTTIGVVWFGLGLIATSGWAQVAALAQKRIHQAPPGRAPGQRWTAPGLAVPVMASLPAALVAGARLHTLPAVTRADIDRADRSSRAARGHAGAVPKRVGLVRRPIGDTIVLPSAGAQSRGPSGTPVRAVAVRSPGAHGLRLHLTGFDAAGGQVIVYATDRQDVVTRGPYSAQGPDGDGDFWTPWLPGDTAYVDASGADGATLQVAEIVHFDHAFPGQPELACHLDVMCEDVNEQVRDATAHLHFVEGLAESVCTGTLLNDLDDATDTPYLLTAHHCLNSQSVVSTLEVVWFYETSGCGGALPTYASLPRSDIGGQLLETNSGNDMAFIRLKNVPAGVGFAGWSTETSAAAYGIHHPAGSWKRYVELDDVGLCASCVCSDPTDFDYYDRIRGLTEEGSSGSGAFNSAGQLVGQLLGRNSTGCNPGVLTCGNRTDFWSIYGEFETTYEDTDVKYWLQLGGTLHVDWRAADAVNTCWDPSGGGIGVCLLSEGDICVTDEQCPPPLQDGRSAHPFARVAQASSTAWDGSRIAIAAGNYGEQVTITRKVDIIPVGGTVTIGEGAP